MKEFGTFLGYALATAAVGALIIFLGGMERLPSWVLPLAALFSVVVMPVVLGIVIARRDKQRAATTPDNSYPCAEHTRRREHRGAYLPHRHPAVRPQALGCHPAEHSTHPFIFIEPVAGAEQCSQRASD